MDDNPLEIRDDEINVEEIMATIRENIRRRKGAGGLSLDPETPAPTTSFAQTGSESDEALRRDLAFINSNWEIHNNNYVISSHRPYIGKMLVKGRQLVLGEVRRYVDPMISRQTEFNASTVRILTQTSQKFAELDLQNKRHVDELTRTFSQQEKAFTRKFSQQQEELARKISQQEDEVTQKFSQQQEELARKFSQQEEELNASIQLCVDKNFREVFSQVDKDLRLRIGLAHLFDERIEKELATKTSAPESIIPADTNYFLFEERFRGTREDIKRRQLEFLPYFEHCSRVLDIGCGRGEFLEILRNHNIGGMGVDLDADMVAYCKSRQLEVEQGDAITYLQNLDDKSVDGIFIDQVVEHLEPAYLVRLLALCHQKMKFGYYLVVETVNPLSFISFANFYIDLTHKRPVHPETLQFLVSAAGFRESEKKFFSPVSDEGRLKTIAGAPDMNETEQKNIDAYNHNVELLNSVLFGAQDYAVIGKK